MMETLQVSNVNSWMALRKPFALRTLQSEPKIMILRLIFKLMIFPPNQSYFSWKYVMQIDLLQIAKYMSDLNQEMVRNF